MEDWESEYGELKSQFDSYKAVRRSGVPLPSSLSVRFSLVMFLGICLSVGWSVSWLVCQLVGLSDESPL